MNHISITKPAIQGSGSRLRSFRTPNGAFPIRGRLALFVLLIFISIIFSSCDIYNPENSSDLTGRWNSAFTDAYEITQNTVIYDDGEWDYGWTGKILEITGSSSGYIYIQYKILEEGLNTEFLEKYIAIHYKNLSETSVQLANSYKVGGIDFAEALEQAKTEFTVENGYFAYHGEYVKQ